MKLAFPPFWPFSRWSNLRSQYTMGEGKKARKAAERKKDETNRTSFHFFFLYRVQFHRKSSFSSGRASADSSGMRRSVTATEHASSYASS